MSTTDRRARTTLVLLLVGAVGIAACSSASEHDDHSLTPLVDVDASDAASAADALPTDGDGGSADVAETPDGAACIPACAATETCCTDAHGHFPTCRAGGSCP